MELLAPRPAYRPEIPQNSSVEAIAIGDIESDAICTIVAAWDKWRGGSALPSRDAISPRDIGRYAANISIARALPDEEDYEFRIIGDAHVQAYGVNNQGKRISDVIRMSPRFGRLLKASYDLVCSTRRAYAFRGLTGLDAPDAHFGWFETCYLPFGIGSVDHVVNAAVYRPRSERWI